MKPLLLLPLIALLAAIPSPVQACAAIGPDNERIDITGEAALIVWDEANKIEHFIRRATFQSTAYDFGFLVPTPTKPEVAESDDEVFTRLAEITAAKIEHRTRAASFGCSISSPKSASGEADYMYVGSNIQVLQHQRVGDHEVVSIKFDRSKGNVEAGAAELAHWLVSSGYGFGDALKDWLKPYVQNNWVITAFRIIGEKAGEPEPAKGAAASRSHDMKAKPIRMSFKTDRPFYPYREPADQRDDKAKNVWRFLKVFFVADARFAGTLGNGPASWAGQTVWADKFTPNERTDVIAKAKLPAEAGPKEWFVTEFDDHSSPRPGTDEVYFAPSADQSTVARPPIIVWQETNTPWVIALVVCFGLPALVIVWLIVKKVRLAGVVP